MRGCLSLGLIVLLGACTANDASIYRKVDFQNGQERSVLIGAKQRAIVSLVTEDRDGKRQIICAEPSPDALSAISTSFASSLSVGIFGQGAGSGALGTALQEAAKQLGTRNATIQLLRDGFYRLCEARLNKSISAYQYQVMVNKYVNSMIVLLAIEQLTPFQAATTAISASDGASVEVNTSVSMPAAPDESRSGSPDSADASEDDTENEATGEGTTGEATAEAGPPVVGIGKEKAAHDFPKHVAAAVTEITRDYLYQSRFMDCLVALDNLSIDFHDNLPDNPAAKLIRRACVAVLAAGLPDVTYEEALKALEEPPMSP